MSDNRVSHELFGLTDQRRLEQAFVPDVPVIAERHKVVYLYVSALFDRYVPGYAGQDR